MRRCFLMCACLLFINSAAIVAEAAGTAPKKAARAATKAKAAGKKAASEPAAAFAAKIDLASDWPWWRGPNRNGVAAGERQPPLTWSETENVLWKTPVPGRGHGSPIVVGDQVFLAVADHDRQVQALICLNRHTGEHVWECEIHRGGFEPKGHVKSSMASSTPACDGERVFVNFLNGDAIWTTAVSRGGRRLWQTKITDYVLHQGFGSSPAVHESLVIVSADNKGTGLIAALDRTTGQPVWRHERPKLPNYTSPVILDVAGRRQLLLTGCDLVSSLDPASGEKLWEIAGSTTECVTSTVTDGSLIFTSGGYPRNHLAAVRADGSGTIAWENDTRVYVPSMIVRDGHLYSVLDEGIAICWKCETGEEVWKGRLGGTFSASPVLVGDRIHATSEAGATFVFRADPAGFELLAENQLGEQALSSAAICGGRIYMRLAAAVDDKRQEAVYCVGVE